LYITVLLTELFTVIIQGNTTCRFDNALTEEHAKKITQTNGKTTEITEQTANQLNKKIEEHKNQ
jgi:hypothetical protein